MKNTLNSSTFLSTANYLTSNIRYFNEKILKLKLRLNNLHGSTPKYPCNHCGKMMTVFDVENHVCSSEQFGHDWFYYPAKIGKRK